MWIKALLKYCVLGIFTLFVGFIQAQEGDYFEKTWQQIQEEFEYYSVRKLPKKSKDNSKEVSTSSENKNNQEWGGFKGGNSQNSNEKPKDNSSNLGDNSNSNSTGNSNSGSTNGAGGSFTPPDGFTNQNNSGKSGDLGDYKEDLWSSSEQTYYGLPEAINPNSWNNYIDDEDDFQSREKLYEEETENGVDKPIREIPEKEGVQDIINPDIDSPDINIPDFPNFDIPQPLSSLKLILIILAILLLAFLIYYFLIKKSNNLSNGSVPYDWDDNPEIIQKTQLEIDLDNAIASKDYRTATRIYYIMLLKDLIERKWITWAKRKTNYHYLLEMSDKKEYRDFNKAISMYEWTWYGKNNPQEDTFNRFEEFYKDFLNRLKDER